MKNLIEKSKYLILIAVFTLIISFALALLWGVANAAGAWVEIVSSLGKSPEISLSLIKLIDHFLLALVLYLLAASIYELLIGDVDLPTRLVARTLPGLKSKLSGIIVLVIAVRFVETLFEEHVQPDQVLQMAAASAVVIAALVAFSYFGNKSEEEHDEEA
jgi:uncharacterized membrane protein YqhA